MTDWGTRAVYYAIGFRFIFQPERSLLMQFVYIFCFWFQSTVSVVLEGLSNLKSIGLNCALLRARLYALNFEIGIESNQLVVNVIYINQFLEIKPAGNVRRKKKGGRKERKQPASSSSSSFFSFPAEQFDYETWILMIQQEEEAPDRLVFGLYPNEFSSDIKNKERKEI